MDGQDRGFCIFTERVSWEDLVDEWKALIEFSKR